MDAEPDIDDKKVADIDREGAFMAPERVSLFTQYILEHFNQKTYSSGSPLLHDRMYGNTGYAGNTVAYIFFGW